MQIYYSTIELEVKLFEAKEQMPKTVLGHRGATFYPLSFPVAQLIPLKESKRK